MSYSKHIRVHTSGIHTDTFSSTAGRYNFCLTSSIVYLDILSSMPQILVLKMTENPKITHLLYPILYTQ